MTTLIKKDTVVFFVVFRAKKEHQKGVSKVTKKCEKC